MNWNQLVYYCVLSGPFWKFHSELIVFWIDSITINRMTNRKWMCVMWAGVWRALARNSHSKYCLWLRARERGREREKSKETKKKNAKYKSILVYYILFHMWVMFFVYIILARNSIALLERQNVVCLDTICHVRARPSVLSWYLCVKWTGKKNRGRETEFAVAVGAHVSTFRVNRKYDDTKQAQSQSLIVFSTNVYYQIFENSHM